MHRLPALAAFGLVLLAGQAGAQALSPNAGPMTGTGVLNDHDGHKGDLIGAGHPEGRELHRVGNGDAGGVSRAPFEGL